MLPGLPPLVAGPLVVALVVAGALASYAIAHKALAHRADEDTRDLAGSVVFRIAALHGLVLALVFAQELAGIGAVREATAREATLVGDIFYDLRRYDAETTEQAQEAIARYAGLVVEEEWAALGRAGTLSPDAWGAWDETYALILDLAPATPRQERLSEILLRDIRELSALREARAEAARAGVSGLFIVTALVGVMLTAAAYFTFPPTALNLTLIGAFAGFSGLIIHFVVAFANPYVRPGHAPPHGFERFLGSDLPAATLGRDG
ncbi:DUF4239 domain-containing protein [Jannaschia aquimarina]|uniref:DUF4239 domain-containing protein n=1 Tax=Jannaschia aquimarina TaxID=935700 RepID=A0A0D1D7W5_9RHOB|nr:DUF4239 domain-containing protein [Jannaschia aquimarina]KIT16053.1 hypothetical protein jaqu_23250 [Jannaschia aquimarina]SNT01180.1 Protein of unknown function [Jannaschia aquimarina]